MGVYIKGMEMPKSCFECKLDLRTDVCQVFCEWNAEHPYSIRAKDRLPDCPLVEVPVPHGDLIDRQKLLEDNKYLEYPTDEKYRRDRAWAVGFNSGARHCNEHAVYAKAVIKSEGE